MPLEKQRMRESKSACPVILRVKLRAYPLDFEVKACLSDAMLASPKKPRSF
ncbi:MAG: hypothetical protein LM590_14715 [Thermofilum sp.]|jgi:hypothetical protein|nr:hypothetical protein [Thermofilum sp.]